MTIHNKFVGGNIMIDHREGDHVYLKNELRDTDGDWFYWAFCVEGAQGQELTFHLGRRRLGYWGPAVSHDLMDWSWHDQVSEDYQSFTYRFGEGEAKVYFAHHILYHPQHLFAFAKKNGLTVTDFCQSRKRNIVPCLQIGEGDISIIFTAHHHCCESTGAYVMEGLVEALVKSPIANTRILAVPFVDYDGVVDGDQGKCRLPHDHNRDYIDRSISIYPEVAALKAYVEKYGCHYGFDLHSPNHWKDDSDHCYFFCEGKKDVFDRFSDLLAEKNTSPGMSFNIEVNRQMNANFKERPLRQRPMFSLYMNNRPENVLACTLESTYAGTVQNKVSAEGLRCLGRDFAEAIRCFICDNKVK